MGCPLYPQERTCLAPRAAVHARDEQKIRGAGLGACANARAGSAFRRKAQGHRRAHRQKPPEVNGRLTARNDLEVLERMLRSELERGADLLAFKIGG